jgi:hypothetical protein
MDRFHEWEAKEMRTFQFTRQQILLATASVALGVSLLTLTVLANQPPIEQQPAQTTVPNTAQPKTDAPIKDDVKPSPSPTPTPKPTTDTEASAIVSCANQSGSIQPKHLWVWQGTVASDPAQRAELLAFAGSRRVQTIYLESEKLITSNQPALMNFIKEAKQHCMNVELLFGAPEWGLSGNHAYAVSLAQKAVVFAALAPVPPVGVQFDVEPYNLPEYKADPNAGGNQYLDMLEKIRAVTAPSKLYFSKAIPLGFEFQDISRGGTTRKLSHAAIERVDRVILMDYRDTSARIIDDASDEIQHAAVSGKKLVIGVETACDTGEVQTITFCEEGSGALEAALAKVTSTFGSNGAFAGMAVHHYASYKSLKP